MLGKRFSPKDKILDEIDGVITSSKEVKIFKESIDKEQKKNGKIAQNSQDKPNQQKISLKVLRQGQIQKLGRSTIQKSFSAFVSNLNQSRKTLHPVVNL